MVDEYIQHPAHDLDAERFAALVVGPGRVQLFCDQHGKGLRYRLGAWHDLWAHASVRALKDKQEVVCDMPCAQAADEMV